MIFESIFKFLLKIIILLKGHPYILSLSAGLFAGETAIISLAILSANGFFNIWIVFVFAYIGEVVADTIYFAIARLKFFHKLNKIKKFPKTFKKTDEIIKKLSNKSIFLTLLYSKFIYGVRTLTVLFLGYKKIKWKKFIVAECFVMLIVMSIIVPVGWFAGKGYKIAIDIFRSIEIAITIIVISLVLFFLAKKTINKILNRKKKKIEQWLKEE